MEPHIDLAPALNFLDDLSKNNNKAWFDRHRPAYEEARDRFTRLVDFLIDEVRPYENLQGLTARDCVYRIHRDLRFSKDKTPYKASLGALVAPGGRKTTRMGFYLQIAPHGQSMAAGGLYIPTPDQLRHFRQAIHANAARFKKILRSEVFVQQFGVIQGERLKTAPQGYDRSHPEIDLLQLKQVTAQHSFPDREVLAAGFPARVVKAWRAIKPFLDYLDLVLF